MPELSGNKKLLLLALCVVVFCAAWMYGNESMRSRKAVAALERVRPEDLKAIYFEGHTVADPAAVSDILHCIKQTQWHAFERNYAQDRHRLVLEFRSGYPWIIELRPLADGNSVVHVLRRDGLAEQRETVMASGDNAELWPMLQHVTNNKR